MTVSRCPRCRSKVIEVLTESGFDVRLDPDPLDPLGELLAAMAGRSTYTRHVGSGAVHHRPARVIRERPAGTRPRQDVHPDHVCPPDRKSVV